MAYALRALPHTILDLLCAMRDYADERLGGKAGSGPRRQLIELICESTHGLVQSKDEFQRISTLPSHRYHVSKHVFIRHMQPIHKGIALGNPDGSVRVTKGMSGLQFVSYHILDAVLGRYHHGRLGALGRVITVKDSVGEAVQAAEAPEGGSVRPLEQVIAIIGSVPPKAAWTTL